MRRPEVATLILILALASGLGIIVVRNVIDARNRTRCAANLKVIGEGVYDYASTVNDHFPPGTVPNEKLAPEERLSWLVALMPYIDGQVQLSMDRKMGWRYVTNNQASRGRGAGDETFEILDMQFLQCRANPNRTAPDQPQVTHYVGISGLGPNAAALPLDSPRAGFFGYDRTLRLDEIKRGRATTLVAIETLRDNGPWLAGGYPTLRGVDPHGPVYLGEHGQFGSHHRRSVNALFADGSVRVLAPSLDPRVFEAMATIAGAEKVSPFDE
jgi:prepilin-type processing-associated H-X9-DG protein